MVRGLLDLYDVKACNTRKLSLFDMQDVLSCKNSLILTVLQQS